MILVWVSTRWVMGSALLPFLGAVGCDMSLLVAKITHAIFCGGCHQGVFYCLHSVISKG
jgi:hypothetical protein